MWLFCANFNFHLVWYFIQCHFSSRTSLWLASSCIFTVLLPSPACKSESFSKGLGVLSEGLCKRKNWTGVIFVPGLFLHSCDKGLACLLSVYSPGKPKRKGADILNYSKTSTDEGSSSDTDVLFFSIFFLKFKSQFLTDFSKIILDMIYKDWLKVHIQIYSWNGNQTWLCLTGQRSLVLGVVLPLLFPWA